MAFFASEFIRKKKEAFHTEQRYKTEDKVKKLNEQNKMLEQRKADALKLQKATQQRERLQQDIRAATPPSKLQAFGAGAAALINKGKTAGLGKGISNVKQKRFKPSRSSTDGIKGQSGASGIQFGLARNPFDDKPSRNSSSPFDIRVKRR